MRTSDFAVTGDVEGTFNPGLSDKLPPATEETIRRWQVDFACSAKDYPVLARQLIDSSKRSLTECCRFMGLSRTTFYRSLKSDPGMLFRKAVIDGLRRLP